MPDSILICKLELHATVTGSPAQQIPKFCPSDVTKFSTCGHQVGLHASILHQLAYV